MGVRTLRRYRGWFIADDHLVLCMNRHGHTVLRSRTKRGIPSGALQFSTEYEARCEVEHMRSWGHWPLFAQDAKPVEMEWT